MKRQQKRLMEEKEEAIQILEKKVKYRTEEIRDNLIKVLTDKKLRIEDATLIIDSMIEADCCGIHTHGIRMLPTYVEKIENGSFNIGDIEIEKSTSAFTVVDANNIIGAVSAYKCAQIAAKKAKESGVHIVFAKNSNTFGVASYYARLIEEHEMIGIVCCNSPAAMPAYYGIEPLLGTNPLAFACPSGKEPPIVFDMATSKVAKSKLELARINSELLPDGWALDKEGNPTNDPIEAIRGLLLPMAGFKGYGLAMMIDIVAGVLSGAGYLNKVNKFYGNAAGMNVGQLFVAIDPEQIYGSNFRKQMDDYIQTLRNSKKVGDKMIVLPGDRSRLSREIAMKEGINIATETIEKLNVLLGGVI